MKFSHNSERNLVMEFGLKISALFLLVLVLVSLSSAKKLKEATVENCEGNKLCNLICNSQ